MSIKNKITYLTVANLNKIFFKLNDRKVEMNILNMQRMYYILGVIRPRHLFNKSNCYTKDINYIKNKRFYHNDEPTEPFDNLPFRVSNR